MKAELVLIGKRCDYSPSLKLAPSLAEYFGLPVEAIFSKQPFKPRSEQVYGVKAAGNPETES